MDVSAYLTRIHYDGPLLPTLETLQGLQRAHLLSVPFENLSIHAHEPILLQNNALFDKIVLRRRGGFCYELNGLFAALLRQLGFQVAMLSAGVAKGENGFGPDFDHMSLMVELKDRWLVDVGFGDSFRQPLWIDSRNAQEQGECSYQFMEEEQYLVLSESSRGSAWKAQYRFTLRPYELADYAGMCQYHQTSTESSFTQRRICTLARPDGRVTLSDLRLIETADGQRRERVMRDEEEYKEILAQEFGLDMGK